MRLINILLVLILYRLDMKINSDLLFSEHLQMIWEMEQIN